MRSYTICTSDGELVAQNVPEPLINRLRGLTDLGRALRTTGDGELVFGPKLIAAHRRKSKLWVALVIPALIIAEIRRDIRNQITTCADNQTIIKKRFSNDNGAGWFYEHKIKMMLAAYADGTGRLIPRAL